MKDEQIVLALRALRLLRRGTLQPAAAPPFLRPYIAGGLGPACDDFAAWVTRSARDPRSAEAAIRFFGLRRLPESLDQIGTGLAADRPGREQGIGSRQVQNLVSQAVTDMTRRGISPAASPNGQAVPPAWHDPFPAPHDPASRPWVTQVLVWGWAQVSPGDRTAAAALLCYEHEHALRARSPQPSSRMERQRWRRLAWSVLHVAGYRAALAADSARRIRTGEPAGASVLAVTSDNSGPDGLAALAAACADPHRLAEPDLAQSALQIVRTAVREGRHEAPELVQLLRHAAARHRAEAGAIPPLLESKLIAVSAIVARERRDPAGIPAARAGLRRIDELLDSPAARRDHRIWMWHVESGYRTSQELADLYSSLGKFTQAREVSNIMRTRIRQTGDPDPSRLPYGWHWNLLVTEAAVNRYLACADICPQPWQRAAANAARHAAELAAAAGLPASWAVAAENEIIAVALSRLDHAAYRASREGKRLLEDAVRRLRKIDSLSRQISDYRDRDTRRALLHAKLLAWQVALLHADPAGIRTASAQVRQMLKSCTAPILPAEAEAIARCETASARCAAPHRAAGCRSEATAMPAARARPIRPSP